MVHPCNKPCGNKTASRYCATTACINPKYSNIGTAHYGQGVQKRIVSNADRIRTMSDEELAQYYANRIARCYGCEAETEGDCYKCQLAWLKSPVEVEE